MLERRIQVVSNAVVSNAETRSRRFKRTRERPMFSYDANRPKPDHFEARRPSRYTIIGIDLFSSRAGTADHVIDSIKIPRIA